MDIHDSMMVIHKSKMDIQKSKMNIYTKNILEWDSPVFKNKFN